MIEDTEMHVMSAEGNATSDYTRASEIPKTIEFTKLERRNWEKDVN
jgi:hypothetical protein